MTLFQEFIQDAIKIDFDSEIVYGQDQVYVSYPIVFPTVTFQLKANSTGETGYCINEQGGQFIDISHEKTGTLRAQMNGHAPCIVEAAGFCTEHSSASRSIGYEEEKSPTLRAGVVPATLLFDNHAQEARYNGPLAESPTITARYGTGGGNTPLIAESIYGISRQSKPSITENLAPALVEKGPHNVAITYGVCSKNSNSMQSDNPHSGFYEADNGSISLDKIDLKTERETFLQKIGYVQEISALYGEMKVYEYLQFAANLMPELVGVW